MDLYRCELACLFPANALPDWRFSLHKRWPELVKNGLEGQKLPSNPISISFISCRLAMKMNKTSFFFALEQSKHACLA